MVSIFKKTAFWEGISLLVLLFVAMPLKHLLGQPLMVKIVGMAHGLLFVLYVVFALYLSFNRKWGYTKTFLILVASLIPFGTFYVDKKYFSEQTT
jgi:integral membrane protein